MTNKKKMLYISRYKKAVIFPSTKKGDTVYHALYIRVHLCKNVFKTSKFLNLKKLHSQSSILVLVSYYFIMNRFKSKKQFSVKI